MSMRLFCVAATLTAAATVAVSSASGRDLTFEERVQAQEAVERVYWKQRIWPAENPGPKPALEAVCTEATLRAKVDDYLRKSSALEELWGRPITGRQLQAEIDRIVRDTRAPEVLAEIFASLGNDELLIAETFARPLLVNRLLRNWYARDDRFHGDRRVAAQHAVRGGLTPSQMESVAPEFVETTWFLENETPAGGLSAPNDGRTIGVDEVGWQRLIDRTATAFATGASTGDGFDRTATSDESRQSVDRLPRGSWSALQEEREAFYALLVLEVASDQLRIVCARWPKLSFDTWWKARRSSFSPEPTQPRTDYTVSPLGNGSCEKNTWKFTRVASAPEARTSHSTVWTGSEMIVWGGISDGVTLNTGGRYDPATDSWHATSANGVLARRDHSAVWTGTEMIVWGGSPGNTGARYDLLADTWQDTSVGAGVPSPRSDHTAVWTGTEMIIWGGGDIDTVFNTGGRYDPANDAWSPTSLVGAPTARERHVAVWTGTEMIVWGGWMGANSGGRYDPQTDSWLPTSGANAPIPRWQFTAVWTGTEMIVWGGTSGPSDYFDTGGRYNPSTNSWSPTSSSGAPSGRIDHQAVWTGTEMIVWGGSRGQFALDTGGRYDPQSDTWSPTAIDSNTPEGRRSHSLVWTGQEMVTWGGANSPGDKFQNGGRYDPSTDSWVPTSLGENMPRPHYWHTAVWTGAEMIIWGGDDIYTTSNTGGRYDPATDDWQLTSTGDNVPPKRSRHTAIWTGAEMIVWGGTSASTTGGRYDPLTDSWTPTSTDPGVPSPRRDHTVVWTGARMIVWGGTESSVNLNTGGIYNPFTDFWYGTSISGAPAPRAYHTAVWTGSEMIVWGGSLLNTGGRFDPAFNHWEPVSTGPGVPVPRYDHTAVWTGSEMIVWGGQGSAGPLDEGGRYDPSSDAWYPMSLEGAPTARRAHTAVWSGLEMIVWGGFDGFVKFDTGGRYRPADDQWLPTAVDAFVPEGRYEHTAVWTGSEMIVWGGLSVDEPTGGRYCPGDGSLELFCLQPYATADHQCQASFACDQVAFCAVAGGAPISQVCDPAAPYDPSTNQVEVTCDDGTDLIVEPCGVTVEDVTLPSLSVSLTPSTLWPPNHRMVDVEASIVASDNCGPPTINLDSVSGNEPDDDPGDGDGATSNDVQQAEPGTADVHFALRAERDRYGGGRLYEAFYTAADLSGNVDNAVGVASVPLDQSGVTEPLDIRIHHGPAGTVVTWSPVPGAGSYDVIRGAMDAVMEIGDTIYLGAVVCIEQDSLDEDTMGFEDAEQPAPGQGFFYLVQYRDVLDSGYGTESTSKPRVPGPGDCN